MMPRLRPWLAQARLSVLIEPFAGGAGVSIAAVAEGLVEHAVLVERDDAVAAVWSVILGDEAPALAARVRVFAATPAAVADALASPAVGDVDRAFQTLLANRVSRGGILHPHAGRLNRGENDRGVGSRWYPDTLADRIQRIAALRDRLTFVHGDGLDVLSAYHHANVGAFIDAPYTAGGKDAGARLYRHADIDHDDLFARAAAHPGTVLLTYDDTPQVRVLATRHGLSVLSASVHTTHHRCSSELVIGRDLGLLRGRRALRHSDSVSCRDVSAPGATMHSQMTAAGDAMHIADAATRLGVSRRTVERLIRDDALVRAHVANDARTYVTAASVAVVERRRTDPSRRGTASGELAAVLASIDKLLAALREDRAALLHALCERDAARAEAAALRAELARLAGAQPVVASDARVVTAKQQLCEEGPSRNPSHSSASYGLGMPRSGQLRLPAMALGGTSPKALDAEAAGPVRARPYRHEVSSMETHFDETLVAELAAAEKQVQQSYRPIIAVHKWFARRPGTLFRGLALAELVHEPLANHYFAAHDLDGVVLDPFMGGGTTLFEANRVGLSVVGYDTNPMSRWLVERELADLDVERFEQVGERIATEVEAELRDLYTTRCEECQEDAPVKSFMWVKTHVCECGHETLLFPGSLVAGRKMERHTHDVVVCGNCRTVDQFLPDETPDDCRHCGALYADTKVPAKSECRCGRPFVVGRPTTGEPPRHTLFALEYHCKSCKHREGRRGRFFKGAGPEDHARFARAQERFAAVQSPYWPEDPIPVGDETNRLLRWGYRRFRDLHNERQMLGLAVLADRIRKAPVELQPALATVYSDFIRYQNMVCRYDTAALKVLDVFSVHGFPVHRVQCEAALIGIPRVGSGGYRHFLAKYATAKRSATARSLSRPRRSTVASRSSTWQESTSPRTSLRTPLTSTRSGPRCCAAPASLSRACLKRPLTSYSPTRRTSRTCSTRS